ncbi:HEPN family nuclease [Pseudomonas cucumis]|uniref:HEPN family nuclease n=1 Tax=Pseudomonas cucumis TaxID=2954082 RepID=A0ABY9EPT2_9PSED|nr:HEPN family nuclease [Pseudomonas cucumis]WLG82740.1 HEPN family nuclease [Pseudomonas cucumis]
MSYFNNFEQLFMRRSLELIDTYQGEYETTQLLNAFIGLLFFPNERMPDLIPEKTLQDIEAWGFSQNCIINAGAHKVPQEINLRELVRRLRNSVAHCRVDPFPNDHRSCEGFCFMDRNGFEAKIPTDQIKNLMRGLLAHLLEQ